MNKSVLLNELVTYYDNRELCVLYIIKKNKPQNLQLFQTVIINNRVVITSTPVSSYKFFEEQWRKNKISPEAILKLLHQHHEVGTEKKFLSDSLTGLTYIYIPSLKRYLK